jgi:hypothetical protein
MPESLHSVDRRMEGGLFRSRGRWFHLDDMVGDQLPRKQRNFDRHSRCAIDRGATLSGWMAIQCSAETGTFPGFHFTLLVFLAILLLGGRIHPLKTPDLLPLIESSS